MSLADFAGDAVKDTLLPTESKGLEKADIPARSDRYPRRDFRDQPGDRERPPREPRGDSPSSPDNKEWRRGPSRNEDRRDAPVEDDSRADDDGNWRASSRPAPSFSKPERTVSVSSRPEEDDWRRAPSVPLARTAPRDRFDDMDNWRKPASAATAPTSSAAPAAPVDERPAHLRNLRASLAARAPVETAQQPRAILPRETKPVAKTVDWGEDEEEEVVAPIIDAEKLSGFEGRLAALLADESKKIDSFAKKVCENFNLKEIETNIPLKSSIRLSIEAARGKDLDAVLRLCRRVTPLFLALNEKDTNGELKVLLISQRICASLGYPRLSPECALLEGFWLGLYEGGAVADGWFSRWADLETADYLEDAPAPASLGKSWGKTQALFQTQALRDWLGKGAEVKETTWDDSEDEEVDAELGSYLDQTLSRRGPVALKKTISAAAARR